MLRIEREVNLFSDLRGPEIRQCEALISVEYSQRNTIARVDGSIETDTCAASRGEYHIAIRIRDENGDFKDLEFSEFWERDDDQPVNFAADYPIGQNVELIRLRSQGLTCTCADSAEE